MATRKVLVLGSTGSIGTSTLSVVESMPERLKVVGMSAGSRWELLAEQVREFRPEACALADPDAAQKVVEHFGDDLRVLGGPDGIEQLVEEVEADVVVGGITGWAGFRPCLKALQQGRELALANKETLVVGGEVVRAVLDEGEGRILPVDSEQSAIFQAMCCGETSEVSRVIVTASGGPFHGLSEKERREVTPADALRHPNWDMGRKITIDSATMMNKALEVIETHWLFDLPADRIDVLIHPQSIIHSMVEFVDGSVMAQMGAPDMRLPIQHALTWPERLECCADRVDLGKLGQLNLEDPGPEELPALELGYEVVRTGGTSGAVFNAANEVAVAAFLDEMIRFTEIVPLVRDVVEKHDVRQGPNVEQLEEADRWAREEARGCLDRF